MTGELICHFLYFAYFSIFIMQFTDVDSYKNSVWSLSPQENSNCLVTTITL